MTDTELMKKAKTKIENTQLKDDPILAEFFRRFLSMHGALKKIAHWDDYLSDLHTDPGSFARNHFTE